MDDRHGLIDDVPVPDDGARQAIATGNLRTRRRTALATLGCGAVVLALVLGVLTLRPADDASVSTAGSVPPATVATPRLGPPLLDLPPEALTATPTVPAGWRTLHHGLLTFSVPDAYFPSAPQADGGCPPASIVLSMGQADLDATTLLCTSTTTMFVVSSYTTPCTGCNGETINGLRVDDPGSPQCVGCPTRFEVPQLQVRIDMPNNDLQLVDQVRRTITLSPVARALADGPTADVADRRPVTERSVGLRVPTGWKDEDVPAGSVRRGGCGQSPLLDHADSVLRGQGGGIPQCIGTYPPVGPTPLDGVWLWSYAEGERSEQIEGPFLVDTFDLGNGRVLVDRFYSPDRVYVEVDTPGGKTLVAVAINTDPTIARTVLRTITVDGRHLGTGGRPTPPTPGSTPASTTTTAAPPPSSTSTTTTPPSSTTSTTTAVPRSSTTSMPGTTTTTTSTPPPDGAPRPAPRDLRADLLSVGASVDTAPAGMFSSLASVSSCGIAAGEPHGQTPEGRCFLAAMARHEEAVVVMTLRTIEGDPIVFVLHTRADRSVEQFVDSTRDKFGAAEWTFGGCFVAPFDLDDPPALTSLCRS